MELYEQGFLSSGHLFHPVLHEIGHHAHYRANPSDFRWLADDPASPYFAEQRLRVWAAVSEYVARDPLEMGAEVYAGRMAGRAFPPDVLRLFRLFPGR